MFLSDYNSAIGIGRHYSEEVQLNLELLKALTEVDGIPGREERVRELVIKTMTPLVDDISVDAMGNVIAHKAGSGPKVMIAAHMDEIGFVVKYIDDKGFLRLDPSGGFDPKTLIAQRVTVHTDDEDLLGIIGSKPIHILSEEERKQPLKLTDLFIDLGLPAETIHSKVNVGDFVTLEQDLKMVGDLACAKALDDRVGVYVMIEAIRKLSNHQADIYAVATVQEEVGLRGARTSGYGVNPDIGIALDVTVAADVPDAKPHEHVTQLGKGAAIKVKDSSHISHHNLVKTFRKVAEAKGIPYQMEVLPFGGTDAAGMQMAREGKYAITLSIPTRYLHSVVEAANVNDIQACVDLLAAYLESAHEHDVSY